MKQCVFNVVRRACLRAVWAGWAGMALAVLVSACGGGAQTAASGGVGSGGSGVAEGSVSGFGSVIVAGVEYDDTNASVVVQNAQGQTEASEVKLGQRVRIAQRQSGVADTIEVLPQLRGTASSAQDAQGVFQLLGQSVQIISSNDAQNTATVLDGLAAVAAGDALEVHGNWVFDSARQYSVLLATRVEKLSAAPDSLLLAGVVRARSGNVLTLDDALGQTLQASSVPAAVAAHSVVTAWLSASALRSSPWAASRVLDASPTLGEGERLALNTQITQTSPGDTAAGYVRVQGLKVQLPSKGSAPAVGATVQMDIVRVGKDYQAVTLTQRQTGNDLGGVVQLKGSVLWPANPAQLNVRGVWVSVPGSALAPNCAGLRTNDSVYLDIQAQRTAPNQPLRASSVSCSVQIPSRSVIEVSGTLTQWNATTKTLQVSTSKGVLNLVWNSSTYLPRQPSSLLNQRVEVEYQTVNGENRLRKLRPD